MAKVLQVYILSAMSTVAAGSCLGRCGFAMNTGSVGSCAVFGCSASRGPTHCTLGSCYCNEGYCRYPVTTMHVQSRTCRQRAGHDTCHMTRFCYNAGLMSTSCSGGLCFCKFGYKYNCDTGSCYYVGNEALLAGNMTVEEMAQLEEEQKESQRETMLNVFVAAMWASAALAVVIGTAFVWRSRRVKVEDAPYLVLEE
eukprot:TRINITY_DN50441_c0_g1_i1.p1 TRINITY_DN50441_c0_g1~~TRINITY_DN50441_c0_g1_i1.p1  ORF type:complete len:197 (+),score=37.42 TRINITY_DN50441_c0_g1_i1:72-662(+)